MGKVPKTCKTWLAYFSASMLLKNNNEVKTKTQFTENRIHSHMLNSPLAPTTLLQKSFI